jgi:hypothetical protein
MSITIPQSVSLCLTIVIHVKTVYNSSFNFIFTHRISPISIDDGKFYIIF